VPPDLDPIAILRDTDPAAAAPLPDRPSLDELDAMPEAALVPARPRTARLVALAAAVLLVVLLAAAAIAVTRPDGTDTPPTDADGTTSSTTTLVPPAPTGETPPRPLPLTVREPAAWPIFFAIADEAASESGPYGPYGPGGGSGPVRYTRTIGWRPLNDPDGGPVRGFQHETWNAPGEAVTWREADAPSVVPGGEVDLDLPLPPATGGLQTGSAILPPRDPSPDDLDAALALLGVVEGETPDPTETLSTAAFLLGAPLTGTERSWLYRALATVDGIEHRGPSVDRAGRAGTAFSATAEGGGAVRELVVVIAAGGATLGVENVLLDSRRGDSIDVPVVTHSQTLVATAYVAEIGDRPRVR
jgi:hypothetical protein